MSGVGSVIGAELPNPGMQISRGAEVGDWQFGWHGVKGWTYFLQQSSNIVEWSYLPWIASGNDGPLGLTVRSSAGAGFFRWRATDRSVADPWTADFDGDGVGNGDELLQGTDPLSAADGDANGLPDDWELFYFQRIVVDPYATAPGGGMTNLQHFTLGSNPNHPPPPPTITAGLATLEQNADTPLYPDDDGQLLLKNGNFSQGDSSLPSLGSNSWWPYPSGIPGWTAISGQIVELQQIEVNTTSRAGQYGELDAHWPTSDHRGDADHGIQQTANLARGHYLLFFDYRGREHDVEAGSFTVKVKSAGSSSDVLLVTKNSASTTTWKRASVSFEITGGNPNATTLPITLQFDSSGAPDSYGAYIDNVILLPVEMMVDANRDGEMSFTEAAIHDKDGTIKDKPFTFWLNSDHDKGGTVDTGDWEEDDYKPQQGGKDSDDEVVEWRRDLEDLTRLWVSFKGMAEMLKQTGVEVKFEMKPMEGETATSAAVRIFPAYEKQDGGNKYLFDDATAWEQVDRESHVAIWGRAYGKAGQGQSCPLPTTDSYPFWTMPSEASPYRYFLFEGVSKGKGRFGAFRWPTFFFDRGLFGIPLPVSDDWELPERTHFDASEHRAWASASGLLGLLGQLKGGQFHGKVRMMAHSMGNVVAAEALRQAGGNVAHTYVASQAALSAHCYDAAAPLMPYYGQPKTTPNVYGYHWQPGVTSFPDQWQAENRPSYMHANYMQGKAGRYVSYYNDEDWALRWPRWQATQQSKPNIHYDYAYSGTSRGFIYRPWDPFQSRDLKFPADRYKIFSWAAESHSWALGAQWVAGVVAQNFNLRTSLGYDDTHKFHSGQFRGTNMQRGQYWERLLIDFGLEEETP